MSGINASPVEPTTRGVQCLHLDAELFSHTCVTILAAYAATTKVVCI